MDRLAWMGLLLVVAACAPDLQTGGAGGAGGAGGTGGGGGAGGMTSSSSGTGGTMGMPCAADAECSGLDTECQMDGQCVNGFCEWTFPISGTPLGMQVYGDCKTNVCDGKGATSTIDPDPSDKYVWGNPCYAPTCGTNAPLASNGVCTTKWGTSGTCQVDFSCRECTGDANCSGGTSSCQNGKCVPAHCVNAMQDSASGETDIDCGGPCAPCDTGKTCSGSGDCAGGGTCLGNPKLCQAPACSDGIKNGDETGVDCGGACAMDPANPLKCATNSNCLYPSDCLSGRCEAGVCK